MKNNKTTQEKSSELEKFKIFFEHTDDNRIIVDRQAREIKRPTHKTASRH